MLQANRFISLILKKRKKEQRGQGHGLVRKFLRKKVPAEKELENPFQQVFFIIMRLIPLQATTLDIQSRKSK